MNSSASDLVRRNTRQHATLLIVEDEPDQRLIVDYALKQTLDSVELVWAGNEIEALQHLDECIGQMLPLPRLVLLDLYLPRVQQGWYFLEQIRSHSWQRHMPVIAFSNSQAPADIIKAYDLGANSYITKPATADQWLDYFRAMRIYWWETVTLPLS
ncbi:response regulator [Spirosoma taeanense]|uniref:Response regulator n=1 Tax=Spirosoma taeanense TaxID=2735870 RepID=A0A6M5Y6X6_9BACT|nr:response regulator [Spirosoma taeanense]QJW89649.1 response regulator [Spirosoma taeanense]